jgi:tetratricopeptide (TPR) repeat protein
MVVATTTATFSTAITMFEQFVEDNHLNILIIKNLLTQSPAQLHRSSKHGVTKKKSKKRLLERRRIIMKTTKLKNLYLSFIICVFVTNVITHTLVHAARMNPGVQRLEEGIVAYEHGEYDDAIFKLEMAKIQILDDDNESLWKAHFCSGLAYYLSGDNEEAMKEFIKANEIFRGKLPDPDTHSPKIVKLFKEAKGVNISLLPTTKFRSTPKEYLTEESVKTMLKDKGFYDEYMNKSVSGFHNDYTLQNDGNVVYDRCSGLLWQQSGTEYMTYENAKVYIAKLNSDRFSGYRDWRLPTLEEAMSLMESTKIGDLYIDPVFDATQRYIWTSDLEGVSRTWVVSFNDGVCGSYFAGNGCVRAVLK